MVLMFNFKSMIVRTGMVDIGLSLFILRLGLP